MEAKVRPVRFSHPRRAMLTHKLLALKGLNDGIGASGRGTARASGKAGEAGAIRLDSDEWLFTFSR